jgi:hypothetical protein
MSTTPTVRHEFEDEDGNEMGTASFVDMTYDVLRTWVDHDPEDNALVFTHRIKIRPESMEMGMMLEGLRCTGMAARWCAIHGNCTCGEGIGDDEHCPLHGSDSAHAEGPTE